MRPFACLIAAVVFLAASGRSRAADAERKASWAEAMASARAAYVRSPEAKQALASQSAFQPFDSGPLDGKGPARQVVVRVAGLREMRLVAVCERHPATAISG